MSHGTGIHDHDRELARLSAPTPEPPRRRPHVRLAATLTALTLAASAAALLADPTVPVHTAQALIPGDFASPQGERPRIVLAADVRGLLGTAVAEAAPADGDPQLDKAADVTRQAANNAAGRIEAIRKQQAIAADNVLRDRQGVNTLVDALNKNGDDLARFGLGTASGERIKEAEARGERVAPLSVGAEKALHDQEIIGDDLREAEGAFRAAKQREDDLLAQLAAAVKQKQVLEQAAEEREAAAQAARTGTPLTTTKRPNT